MRRAFRFVYENEAGVGYSAIMEKEIVLNLEMRFFAHKRGKCNTFVYFFPVFATEKEKINSMSLSIFIFGTVCKVLPRSIPQCYCLFKENGTDSRYSKSG